MRMGLTMVALGYRDALGRMARRTPELQRQRRELLRTAGRKMVAALERTAPRKTGLFAAGIFYRTYDYGLSGETRFYAGGPHGYLLPWLTEGTRPHVIPKGGSAAQIAKGYPLSFYWEKGPQGPRRYSYWSVRHPGTQPNPFVDRAAAHVTPDLIHDVQRAARQVAWL